MPLNRTARRVSTGVIRRLPASGAYTAVVTAPDDRKGTWCFDKGVGVKVG